MVGVGRYTAALLLVTTGILLLIDIAADKDYILLLAEWWPLLFVALGLEHIVLSLIHHNTGKQLKIVFKSIAASAFISAVVVFIVVSGFNPKIGTWSVWDNNRVEQEVTVVPLFAETEKVVIVNLNGSVIVQEGDIGQIEVESVLYYPRRLNEEEEQRILAGAGVTFSGGKTIRISATGNEYRHYFIEQQPRMDLTVTVPRDRNLDIELQLADGIVGVVDH